jgi:hypothetical protein
MLSACQLVYGGFINNILNMCWYFLVNVVKLTVYKEHNIP